MQLPRFILALLATLCLFAAAAHGQTIKSLGFNTTNGQVVTGTNTLRFTNNVSFQSGPFINNNGVFYGPSEDNGLHLANQELMAQGQAIIGYNTNVVEFTVPLTFSTNVAATTRTNLGLLNPSNGATAYYARGLWDDVNSTEAIRISDMDVFVDSGMLRTNGPTNATNVSRWINVLQGTNIYKLPLYK